MKYLGILQRQRKVRPDGHSLQDNLYDLPSDLGSLVHEDVEVSKLADLRSA